MYISKLEKNNTEYQGKWLWGGVCSAYLPQVSTGLTGTGLAEQSESLNKNKEYVKL